MKRLLPQYRPIGMSDEEWEFWEPEHILVEPRATDIPRIEVPLEVVAQAMGREEILEGTD
jgi:hypothetical protein